MDLTTLNTRGSTPITDWLDLTSGVTNIGTLMDTLGIMHNYSIPGLFSFFVDADLKSPDMNSATLYQGGLVRIQIAGNII